MTRVGKGFAYIQFHDANAVEKALLYDGQKFPPMLPRVLRVTRAKRSPKLTNHDKSSKNFKERLSSTKANERENPSEVKSQRGRAGKLLGRAGAAQYRHSQKSVSFGKSIPKASSRSPHTVIREDRQPAQGHKILKAVSGKRSGKQTTRSRNYSISGRKART